MIAVFIGPTIARDHARAILDADFLPPASQGDVYRVTRKNPDAIAIIDGNFEGTPAVWHKEILWALSRGIPVYGSSSMGALRAAELDTYGMIGVGAVYESFRDGKLEDDDEVAVLHADASAGWRPLSDAMVDIRRMTRDAHMVGILSGLGASAVVREAKSQFYKERTLMGAVQAAEDTGQLTGAGAEAFRAWIAANRTSQKREDAVSMLRLLATTPMVKHRPTFHFEYSALWNDFRLLYGEADPEFEGGSSRDVVSLEDIADELRLVPGMYAKVFDGALLRLLSTHHLRRTGSDGIPLERRRKTANGFRIERGLFSEKSLRLWCTENGLSYPNGLRKFVDEQTCIEIVREQNQRNAWVYLINELRESGLFAAILARARAKRVMLRGFERDLKNDAHTDADDAILEWYFEANLQRPDLAADPDYYRKAGFKQPGELARAIRREYYFAKRCAGTETIIS